MELLRKSLSILNARERRTGLMLLGLSIVKGFADMVGVASILPFLAVISDPGLVDGDGTIGSIYRWLGFTSTDQFLVVLGFAVVGVLIFSAVVRAVTVYSINRWTEMREYNISARLLETYLRQPYVYFITRNTGDMGSAILSLARNVIILFYRPLGNIMSSVFTFLLIAGLLVWADPITTLVAVVLIGGAYLLLYRLVGPLIKKMGRIVVETNNARFRAVSETLGDVKQVKLSGRGRTSLDQYRAPALEQAQARALSNTLNQVPRFGLEVVAFGGVVLLTLFLVLQSGGAEGGDLGAIIPLMGLYALAGYRILPSLQMLYTSFNQIRMSGAVVDTVYRDLQGFRDLPRLAPQPAPPSGLKEAIKFDRVSYTYPSAERPGIREISFEIHQGTSVGIVGPTGAGKTTLVDLFLGLLEADDGRILIDGVALDQQTVRGWQSSIGYVPQEIVLTDNSAARNIAFGVPPDEISRTRLEKAARLAHIHDFIVTELENGYDTIIGERGVRLSGGQRQRFGIARALYHDPSVIVFDEATSALDNATEAEVMRAINELSRDHTILMIAHRLSTIEKCDKILVLENGALSGFDSYDRIAVENAVFRSLKAG